MVVCFKRYRFIDVTIFATGSECSLAIEVSDALTAEGISSSGIPIVMGSI